MHDYASADCVGQTAMAERSPEGPTAGLCVQLRHLAGGNGDCVALSHLHHLSGPGGECLAIYIPPSMPL